MKEKYICVLVTPKKYREMLEEINNCNHIIIPKKYQKKDNREWVDKVETLYNLPVEISTVIDEDIKYVTKEQYEEYRTKSIKQYEDFMKNYEPDYMWK